MCEQPLAFRTPINPADCRDISRVFITVHGGLDGLILRIAGINP